jgi:integrase
MPTPSTNPASGLLSRETVTTDLTDLVLAGVPSPHTRRSYDRGIKDLFVFAGAKPITLILLLKWREAMAKKNSAATVNNRITAVKRLIVEARRTKLIPADSATELLEIKGLPQRGGRTGNWLDQAQVRALLAIPDRKTLRGKRNHCILSILVGCALRRYELTELDVSTIQQREGRWVLADLIGKGGRVRTVAVPGWVKQSIDSWTKAARIESGRVIRRMTLEDEGLSDDAVWEIVRDAALEIGVPNFGPHDLRRTCAKLCRKKGGHLEQIQMLLGHASIQTTERYLGSTQNLKNAVNDDLGL